MNQIKRKKLNNGRNDVYASFQPIFQAVWLLGVVIGRHGSRVAGAEGVVVVVGG
jgi:hypothetical protein